MRMELRGKKAQWATVIGIYLALFFLWLSSPAGATPVTLFNGAYTGAELDELVSAGEATYPTVTPTVNGSRLDFGPGSYGDILYRLAILDAGDMASFSNLVVTFTVDWAMLSTDNDLSFAISDGSQLIGVNVGDQSAYWGVDGQDNGTSYYSSWSPSGSIARTMPITVEIAVGPTQSTLTLTNGSSEEKTFELAENFNDLNQIDFILGRDHSGEQYGINTLSLRAIAEAIPLPEPATGLLLGFGLIGWAGLRRQRTD